MNINSLIRQKSSTDKDSLIPKKRQTMGSEVESTNKINSSQRPSRFVTYLKTFEIKIINIILNYLYRTRKMPAKFSS